MLQSCKKDLRKFLEIDAKKFNKRSEILKKFIYSDDLKLESLYAIQYLNNRQQHSPKLIRRIFKLLFNGQVYESIKFFANGKKRHAKRNTLF